MLVHELIAILRNFDPNLPVCLADWSEDYALPSMFPAQSFDVMEGLYRDLDCREARGRFLCIGMMTE